MYKRILIATDGSETAMRALRVGADLAQSMSSEIIICHVGSDERGKAVLERAVEQAGGSPRTISVEGDPADKILDVAEAEGVDLIVIGNKGMTGARRLLLGSVPNSVSHHAPCNVLIVKTV